MYIKFFDENVEKLQKIPILREQVVHFAHLIGGSRMA